MIAKRFLPGLIIGGLASAAILGSGRVLYGWSDGDIAEYALSEPLYELLGLGSLALGAAVLLLLSKYSPLNFLVSVCVVPLPILGAIFFEMERSPTSHNLWPIEMIPIAAGALVLHLPALFLLAARIFRAGQTETD